MPGLRQGIPLRLAGDEDPGIADERGHALPGYERGCAKVQDWRAFSGRLFSACAAQIEHSWFVPRDFRPQLPVVFPLVDQLSGRFQHFINSPDPDERIIKPAPIRRASFGGPSEAFPLAVRTGGIYASLHASGISGS